MKKKIKKINKKISNVKRLHELREVGIEVMRVLDKHDLCTHDIIAVLENVKLFVYSNLKSNK